MRKLTLILFFLPLFFLPFFPAFAADNKEEPAGQEATTQVVVEREKIVSAIEVSGNKSISTNTIISKMKTRVGSPFIESVSADDLKRLFALGYFEDINISTQDDRGKVKVIVRVIERPLIAKINFSGITRITMKDEKLKEQLKSKEGQHLDIPRLSEDERILKKMYEKMGYSAATIEHKVSIDKETGKAAVEFVVSEGKRVRIKDIIVKGAKAFRTPRVLKLLKTKRAWLFNAGVYKDEVFKEDIERIKAFYRKSGYADVEVESEVKPDMQKPYLLYVYISIEEGRKYLVGSVSIEGNKDILEKDILSALKACTPGAVYSEEALKTDVSSIQGLYFDRGYIALQVQETASLSTESGRVDIKYNIVENDICYVDKIKIRGNVKTKDIVIRRELRIHPGDKFDGDKLHRSKERLENLGFFEEIGYDTQDTTKAPNKKDLIVDVKESKTGAFSFGGGYSTVDDFIGFVEIEQNNFDWKNWPYFTGAGQDIKFRASFGTVTSGFDISFTEPWLFDYPISAGFDLYKRKHKRDTEVGYGYSETVTGGDLRIGKEISEYVRGNITYRLDEIDITDITSNATSDLQDEYGKNSISSLTFDLNFDSRDNVFDTRKGEFLTGSFMLAGGPLGADKDFYKFFARASHFIPLARKSALEFRGRLGLAKPYDNTKKVPIYERYFAGGSYTVRGYEERKVGPIDPVSKDPLGGEGLLVGNIEYTYPFLSFLKGAAFYDVGNVWEKLRKLGSGGYKSGIGLGVRIKTPIGPIMLDYGIPLNKEPGLDRRKSGRIHFSASHGF